MADKKDSQRTEKVTLVGDDLIPVLDSEELVISEQNKIVKVSNLVKAGQSFDIWTVASPVGEPTLTGTLGRYVKTGVEVLLTLKFTVPANSDASPVFIPNIPFTSVNTSLAIGSSLCINGGTIENHLLKITGDEMQIQFHDAPNGNNAWLWQNAAGFAVVASITYITDEFVI